MNFSSPLVPKGCKSYVKIVDLKSLLTLSFIVLISISAFSQNTFPSTGNVGIGTTSPYFKLDVAGRVNGGGMILGDGNGTRLNGPGVLHFRASGSGNNHMTILSNGYVGIGTTSPTSRLTVDGNLKINNQYQSLLFSGVGSNYGGISGNSGYNTSLNMFHQGGIEFQTGANTTDHTKMRMYINGQGNVGINTRFPTEKLMVDGNIKLATEWQELLFAGNNGVSGGMRGNSGHQTSLTMYHGHSLEFQTGSNGIDLNNVRMHINNLGNVGIGTRTPGEKLTVDGNVKLNTEWQQLLFGGNNGVSGGMRGNSGHYTSLTMYHGHSLEFQTGSNGIDHNNVRMHISTGGNIGIGTRTPTQKLTVAGKINAEEIILEDVSGADFVFEEDYDLRSLEETEAFIKAHKHLPEIPSAAEMAEEGLEIKAMNILLLQKVEELTLHLIEMNKTLTLQQETIDRQQKVIENQIKHDN